MATVNPTFTYHPDQYNPQSVVVSWTLTAANAEGAPVTLHEYGDRTFQVTGTFDSATVVLSGANVDTYTTLVDPQGNAISKTAAAIEAVLEMPFYVKPTCSGGGGSQSTVVTLFCRRTRR